MNLFLFLIVSIVSIQLHAASELDFKSSGCIRSARELFGRNQTLSKLNSQNVSLDAAYAAQIVDMQKSVHSFRAECSSSLGAVAADLIVDSMGDEIAFQNVVGCVSMLVYFRQESSALYGSIPDSDSDLLNQSVGAMKRSVGAARAICEKDIPDSAKRQLIFSQIIIKSH